MEFGLFYGGENGEHTGTGLSEISKSICGTGLFLFDERVQLDGVFEKPCP